MRDIGEDHGGRIWADASAALGIIHRRGFGKATHIDTHCLWIQETAARKTLLFNKVKGADNHADLFTKYLDQGTMAKHCIGLSMKFPNDRASLALRVGHIKLEDGGGKKQRGEEREHP